MKTDHIVHCPNCGVTSYSVLDRCPACAQPRQNGGRQAARLLMRNPRKGGLPALAPENVETRVRELLYPGP
jgi:hypothetical protein